MGDNVGTLKKVVIDGVSYDVFVDINVSFTPTRFKREDIPTSGRTLHKMTKRVRKMEDITIAASPAEVEALASKAESLASKTIAVEFADGSIYRATGQIDFDKWESQDGKGTVTLIPDKDWTPFLAN